MLVTLMWRLPSDVGYPHGVWVPLELSATRQKYNLEVPDCSMEISGIPRCFPMLTLSNALYFPAHKPIPGSDKPVDVKTICGHPFHASDPHWICEGCRTIPSISRKRIHACQTIVGQRKDGSKVILQGAPRTECPQCLKFEPHMRLQWLKPKDQASPVTPENKPPMQNLKYRGKFLEFQDDQGLQSLGILH